LRPFIGLHRSFKASISTFVSCGASPVFAGVNENFKAISAQTIEKVPTCYTNAAFVNPKSYCRIDFK